MYTSSLGTVQFVLVVAKTDLVGWNPSNKQIFIIYLKLLNYIGFHLMFVYMCNNKNHMILKIVL